MPTSQFTPPQGDYKLLVLRPDVTVGSLTTGGMVEPRADWTEQARANIVAALRAQQAARGGKVTIVEHRNELPGVTAAGAGRRRAAELRRRPVDRRPQISRRLSADQARQGPRLDARRGRRPARPEDRLRLCACSSTPRTRSRPAAGSRLACSDLPAASSAFARPTSAAQQQLDYASLVDLKTGEVVWFNVVQAGSQVPGIKFGDLRTPQGAAQMVDRLLGRMKPGTRCRQGAASAQGSALMCVRCLEISRRSLLRRRRRCRGRRLHTGVAQARIRAAGHGPAGRPRLQPDRPRRDGPVAARWSGSRRRSPAPTCSSRTRSSPAISRT